MAVNLKFNSPKTGSQRYWVVSVSLPADCKPQVLVHDAVLGLCDPYIGRSINIKGHPCEHETGTCLMFAVIVGKEME